MIETSGHIYKLDQEDGQSVGGCLEVSGITRLGFFFRSSLLSIGSLMLKINSVVALCLQYLSPHVASLVLWGHISLTRYFPVHISEDITVCPESRF